MPPAQQTSDFVTAPLLFLAVFVGTYVAYMQCCHRTFRCVAVDAIL